MNNFILMHRRIKVSVKRCGVRRGSSISGPQLFDGYKVTSNVTRLKAPYCRIDNTTHVYLDDHSQVASSKMTSPDGSGPQSNETQHGGLDGLPRHDNNTPSTPSYNEPDIISSDNSPSTADDGLERVEVHGGLEIARDYSDLEAVSIEMVPIHGLENAPNDGPEAIYEALLGGNSEDPSGNNQHVDPKEPIPRIWRQLFHPFTPETKEMVLGFWSRNKCLMVTVIAVFLLVLALAVGLGVESMRSHRTGKGMKSNSLESNLEIFQLKTLSF